MQKIMPFLWFDDKAEEAAKFYTSIFKNSKIGKVSRYGKEGYEVQEAGGNGNDCGIPNRGAKFHSAKRRAPVQVHRGRVILCGLQDAGGSGRALEEAYRRRRGRSVRLA